MNAINNKYKVVLGLGYDDLSGGGKAGDIISLKNYGHVDIVITIGETAGATSAVTLDKGTSVSSCDTELTFEKYYSTAWKIPITSATGTFTAIDEVAGSEGEQITGGSSSSTATVVADKGDYLIVAAPSAAFTNGEQITGGTSGYTATVDGAPTELDYMAPRIASSNTFNTAAVADRVYVIPIDAEDLGDGYDTVEVNMADAGSSQTDCSILYVLSEPRYMDQYGGPSAIVD